MPDASDFELGRTALLEITSAESIGENAGSIDEGEGVTTVYFETTLSGYPGWRWTVSIAHLADAEPSVLETELTPGDDALLSPAWVPWVDRLADYKAAQLAAGEALVEDDADDELDDDDDDDIDDDDDDDLGSDVLHGGDVDGVDIDDADIDDADLEYLGLAASDEGVPEGDDADGEPADDGEEDDDAERVDDDEHEKSY